jgi:heptosyltransferase-1
VTAVLVVRPSSLGDIVHALSLVDDVVAFDPAATIDWVAEEAFVELPALCPRVRRVIPLALRRWKRAPLAPASWKDLRTFLGELRTARYDIVLDLQEQVKGALVARAARGVRHGFDRDSIREPVASFLDDVHHAVPRGMHFAMRCRMLAASALGYEPKGVPRWQWLDLLPAPLPPGLRGEASDTPYMVALHATSRASKLWPDERWIALLQGFAHAGFASVLPWGSDRERARSESIAARVTDSIVPPRQTLSALAALLQRAEIVVGVDTGLTHLAAALRTPTIALFTETDPSGAGVAIAGTHAVDLGGNGAMPSVDEVRSAAGALAGRIPAC